MNFEFEIQCIEQEENEEYEETESFLVQEKNTDGETTKQLSPPEVNTTFNSETEVCEYYKQYGLQNEFGIMIRNTRKIDGVNTYLTVACNGYGEPNQKVVDSLKPKPVVKQDFVQKRWMTIINGM